MDAISEHISYQEATRSATALAKGIDNTPSEYVVQNMKLVASHIFEPVRHHFGLPITISSFYRSAELNKAIGGAASSQHISGQALDMDGDVHGSPTNKHIFEYVRDNLSFDQLIVEGIHDGKMDWVHCSYKPSSNRNQILFMYVNASGKKVYENYTHERYLALIK